MTKWKLSRVIAGTEEFVFSDGTKVTVGRGVDNTITIPSLVISRHHCVIEFEKDSVSITDLKSSNGTYIGPRKIPQNTRYEINHSDIIGFGWTKDIAGLATVNDDQKHVFKLVKETYEESSKNRITFQSDNESDNAEEDIISLDKTKITSIPSTAIPICQTKPYLKRQLQSDNKGKMGFTKEINIVSEDVISLLSDSENECVKRDIEPALKKVKLETVIENVPNQSVKEEVTRNENDLQYEAFKVKQEYMGYNDELIEIESDSDHESEQWLLRLSQSSPGKPFTKVLRNNNSEVKQEDSSYSQLDDISLDIIHIGDKSNDEEFTDDLISIPNNTLQPPLNDNINSLTMDKDDNLKSGQIASIKDVGIDKVDGVSNVNFQENHDLVNLPKDNGLMPLYDTPTETQRKIQLIEPLIQPTRKKLHHSAEDKPSMSSTKHAKNDSYSSNKQLSKSQKEQRKKKLKEIATKDKEQKSNNSIIDKSNKSKVNVKVTASNRGAFLSDVAQAVVKPIKKKISPDKSNKNKEKPAETKIIESINDNENKEHLDKANIGDNTISEKEIKNYRSRNKSKALYNKYETKTDISEPRTPLQSLKPPEKDKSEKPVNKVEPFSNKKPMKKVRFSDVPPQVRIFVIEPGNKLKKTSLVKATLLDIRQLPVFSLEKITLIKILRWNPCWLEEQMKNNDPPPILGNNKPPLAMLHSFKNHEQYVQLIGDLLLMEIWECLTQTYMKIRTQENWIQMVITSLPPVPTQDRYYELFTLSVNIFVPKPSKNHKIDTRNLPRVGEVLYVNFTFDNVRNTRFFYVHNVRHVQSPSTTHTLYNLSLHCTYTEKMNGLQPGHVMCAIKLAYINNELTLFQAMECLARSPLRDAILRPEPKNFPKIDPNKINIQSQWTVALNESQLAAVSSSVAAALGDRPSIQMVQGPPGTGKSSVICAIVMTYFYDSNGKKHQNRGKILICAPSNPAVDELVLRLLEIRHKLPKSERFRMVRVGRVEAMHPQAHNISSQQLAQRDAARMQSEATHESATNLNDEIFHLEAKINMYETSAKDAKEPARVAYYQGRVAEIKKRIALLRGGGTSNGYSAGGEIRPEQLAKAERRIVEGADIIVTTLASAHNFKMKGLQRRIALCIIDEAGQAIEPETLIPLTLDVTKMTLIGDPQQLPGFICSQRAKQHGLGESLFARLTSCSEHWSEGSPVMLLNRQYRMHPEIADYPNRAFYDGRIETYAQIRTDLNIPSYSIISISSGDRGQDVSGANEIEAWGVSRLVLALHGALKSLKLNIAVITPYQGHKELIKKCLRSLVDTNEPGIEVNTVDSFQGQERDVVVVSLARSHGVGFLTDAGRMNVMLTRAKYALFICLNPNALLRNHQWQTLVEDAQKRKVYRTLPNKVCQPVSATQVANEDILKYITDKKPNHVSKKRSSRSKK